MTSKEALEYLLVNSEELYNQYEEDEKFYLDAVELYNIVLKDLEILECFRKIPKQDLKDFIEWQIRYEKNMKTWLEERHFCYIGKEEEYTKHLFKIKEWLNEKEKEERVEND